MQPKYWLLSIFILISFSCKTQQNYTPDNYEGNKLTFGSSGGFAGTTSEHYIFENGQVFSFESRPGVTKEVGIIEKKVVKQIFDNFTNLGLDKLMVEDPGNINFYVKMKTGDEEKVLTWGGMNDETPPILKQYFTNLGQIVKKYKKEIKNAEF